MATASKRDLGVLEACTASLITERWGSGGEPPSAPALGLAREILDDIPMAEVFGPALGRQFPHRVGPVDVGSVLDE